MKTVKIQGVLVSVGGVGVLIRGAAGSGKSLAALDLMRRGHYLVADDLVAIFTDDSGETIIGKPVEEDVRIEIRGLGIFFAKTLFSDGILPEAKIDLVANLDEYDTSRDLGRVSPEISKTRLMDLDVLTVRVPVASGMNPGLLIEMLASAFKKSGMV